MAQVPVFNTSPASSFYSYGAEAAALTVSATAPDGGIITYQWQMSRTGTGSWRNIPGQTGESYTPSTTLTGSTYYRVIATNTYTEISGLYPTESLYPSGALFPQMTRTVTTAAAISTTAKIYVAQRERTEAEKLSAYMAALRRPYTKLCRLRFLQPDGTTAFSVDNNPRNDRAKTFIQAGSISCNLQNGKRRSATVTLSNVNAEYDYNVNNIWFGQQVALDEGLILPGGEEYYIQQGVFYIEEPQEALNPNERTVTFPLTDKWSYLDGTLFGNLEGTYEVPVNTNIFEPIRAILALDRGNGQPVDSAAPIFTSYYNGMTQELPSGGTANLVQTPYTFREEGDGGTYASVCLGMAAMVNAWIGYDQTGALRVEPSQDDIVDTDKPVLWQFTLEEAQILGAAYTTQNADVYNDFIVIGQSLDSYAPPAGRATNMDVSSTTNIYTSLGRRTQRVSAAGYYTEQQCKDLAEWRLKRATVLNKSVSVSCIQMFHISENNLITIVRTDKPGSPVERHLIQGFTRPLTTTGAMTLTCTSVNDFPVATITGYPE